MRKDPYTHYDYLGEHLARFMSKTGVDTYKWDYDGTAEGLTRAHGDKCYSYKHLWEEFNIPFERGVAIYLLTYVHPYAKEVRETDSGWVDPKRWVISKYEYFRPYLMEVEDEVRGESKVR